MNICHFTYSEKGGAGIAVNRLNTSLVSLKGINSKVVTYDMVRFSSIKNRFKASYNCRIVERFKYYKLKKYNFWSTLEGFDFNNLKPFLNGIDIINLHWIGRFVSYKSLSALSEMAPLVWTVHDKNPFRECFHYDLERKKFLKLNANIKFLTSHELEKKNYLNSVDADKLVYVSPCKTYSKQLAISDLTKNFKNYTIPNGVNTNKFSVLDKTVLRKKYGIPNNKKILMFIAHDISNKYKGFGILADVIKKLGKGYFIVLIGNENIGKLDFPCINFGFIDDDVLLSEIYNLADVFINPTLEDNLPNTILESLACGVPVIGSNIGGVPDLVRPGVTGDLFEPGDSENLIKTIKSWFERKDLKKISNNCREIAVKEYDSMVQARAYKKMYKEVLGDY